MAAQRKKSHEKAATTPQTRENQMINLAVECAERQMKEGTASASVITHYLKLGTEREKLEREKIKRENDLAVAKKEKIESDKNIEELFSKAMEAFTSYSGRAISNEVPEEQSE